MQGSVFACVCRATRAGSAPAACVLVCGAVANGLGRWGWAGWADSECQVG